MEGLLSAGPTPSSFKLCNELESVHLAPYQFGLRSSDMSQRTTTFIQSCVETVQLKYEGGCVLSHQALSAGDQ